MSVVASSLSAALGDIALFGGSAGAGLRFEGTHVYADGGFRTGANEARKLVAALGGRLTVESAPGRGTTFTLHLPLADKLVGVRGSSQERAA